MAPNEVACELIVTTPYTSLYLSPVEKKRRQRFASFSTKWLVSTGHTERSEDGKNGRQDNHKQNKQKTTAKNKKASSCLAAPIDKTRCRTRRYSFYIYIYIRHIYQSIKYIYMFVYICMYNTKRPRRKEMIKKKKKEKKKEMYRNSYLTWRRDSEGWRLWSNGIRHARTTANAQGSLSPSSPVEKQTDAIWK